MEPTMTCQEMSLENFKKCFNKVKQDVDPSEDDPLDILMTEYGAGEPEENKDGNPLMFLCNNILYEACWKFTGCWKGNLGSWQRVVMVIEVL